MPVLLASWIKLKMLKNMNTSLKPFFYIIVKHGDNCHEKPKKRKAYACNLAPTWLVNNVTNHTNQVCAYLGVNDVCAPSTPSSLSRASSSTLQAIVLPAHWVPPSSGRVAAPRSGTAAAPVYHKHVSLITLIVINS